MAFGARPDGPVRGLELSERWAGWGASRSPPSPTRTSRSGRSDDRASTREVRRGARSVALGSTAIMPNERTSSVAELRAGGDGTRSGCSRMSTASSRAAASRPVGRRAAPSPSRACCRHFAGAASGRKSCGRSPTRRSPAATRRQVRSSRNRGSTGFAARFGFAERNRQIEQVYTVRGDEREADLPDGIAVVPLRRRDDLRARLYAELVEAALADFALDRPSRSPRRSGGAAGSRRTNGRSWPLRATRSSAWRGCSTTTITPRAPRIC